LHNALQAFEFLLSFAGTGKAIPTGGERHSAPLAPANQIDGAIGGSAAARAV
jgi:hypothetical protein